MTAPAATARQVPSGIKLKNGYRSLITFALDADIDIFEIEVTPPGMDSGDEIDTTTMFNDTVVSKAPNSPLVDVTNSSFTAGYDPKAWNQLMAIVGKETTITKRYPNGDTLAAYGFLKSFEPSALQRGEMPTLDGEIVYTNTDPTTGEEELPVLTEYTGTGTGG